MESPQNLQLVLAGFSGAGKSSVLRALERELKGFHCSDLDQLTSQGFQTVAEMIQQVGWEKFRAAEVKALENALNQGGRQVIALGGGALTEGWPILEQFYHVKVVYLECPFEICWQRIQLHTEERPLVQKGEAAMRELFEQRKPLFEKAHHRVDATLPLPEVVLAIRRLTLLA